jgi:hypothetical protein
MLSYLIIACNVFAMLNLTDDYIDSLPADTRRIPDVERGLYVLQTWQKNGASGSPASWLKNYMIRSEGLMWINQNIIPKLGVAIVAEEKTEKRKDKYAKLEKLALDNLYHEFTTQQLADESGLGAQTISKWAKTTGYFRVIGRGKWEARNPKDDRKNA